MTNGSVANQAGEFLGSFVFTLVAKVVRTICAREHTDDKQIATSVCDLGDLIEQIDMFKVMHDFAQEFLTEKLRLLFGGDGIVYENTADIQKAWRKFYERDYESSISLFKKRLDTLRQKVQAESDEEEDNTKPFSVDLDIRKSMEVLENNAPNALKVAEEFIAEIEKRADEALSGGLPAVPEFKESVELKAHRVLSHADTILVALISILTHLYSKMTHGINETN